MGPVHLVLVCFTFSFLVGFVLAFLGFCNSSQDTAMNTVNLFLSSLPYSSYFLP